jgi:hypothetical protein
VIVLGFIRHLTGLEFNLKARDFIQQIQGVKMENKEIINDRVQIARQYLRHLQSIMEEVSDYTDTTSYSYDLAYDTLRKTSLIGYNLDVLDKMTEKVTL